MSPITTIRARVERGGRDAGMTLAELLVVSLVSTILLGALGTFVGSSLAAARRTTAHTAATSEARLAMDVVARRLRVAVRPTGGGPMITTATATSVEFWASLGAAGSDADQPPTRVRYAFDPTRRCLLETLTPSTGLPRSTCLASGQVTPQFQYFQVTKPPTAAKPSPSVVPTTPLAMPVADPNLVASVRLVLTVVDVREPSKPVRLETRVLMGNHHNER